MTCKFLKIVIDLKATANSNAGKAFSTSLPWPLLKKYELGFLPHLALGPWLGLPKIEVEEPLSPRVGVMRRISGARGRGALPKLKLSQSLSQTLPFSRQSIVSLRHVLSCAQSSKSEFT